MVASTVTAALLVLVAFIFPCRAETVDDVQKRFHDEINNQPFGTRDESDLDAYIEEATRKGIVPGEYTGSHWRAGATCEDLRAYSWTEYRDCMYYYRYYGRYYSLP